MYWGANIDCQLNATLSNDHGSQTEAVLLFFPNFRSNYCVQLVFPEIRCLVLYCFSFRPDLISQSTMGTEICAGLKRFLEFCRSLCHVITLFVYYKLDVRVQWKEHSTWPPESSARDRLETKILILKLRLIQTHIRSHLTRCDNEPSDNELLSIHERNP